MDNKDEVPLVAAAIKAYLVCDRVADKSTSVEFAIAQSACKRIEGEVQADLDALSQVDLVRLWFYRIIRDYCGCDDLADQRIPAKDVSDVLLCKCGSDIMSMYLRIVNSAVHKKNAGDYGDFTSQSSDSRYGQLYKMGYKHIADSNGIINEWLWKYKSDSLDRLLAKPLVDVYKGHFGDENY